MIVHVFLKTAGVKFEYLALPMQWPALFPSSVEQAGRKVPNNNGKRQLITQDLLTSQHVTRNLHDRPACEQLR